MTEFRRLVLAIGDGGGNRATMRQAAALARMLGAELHALFVEDETLLHASGFPFAREISPLSLQWRPLEPDRLEADLRAAADQSRRYLMEAARATGVRQKFEVRRGDLAVHITQICAAGDVVVVSPARRMGNGSSHALARLHATAGLSAASVLLLPPFIGRAHGPIVAVAARADDPGLAAARRIAAHAHEHLLVLAPPNSEIPDATEIRYLAGNTAHDVLAALGDTRERLIVLTRVAGASPEGDEGDPGSALAAARGVPVLVVGPD